MSLTRYAPQIVDAFRQPVTKPIAFARALAPGVVLVLAGMAIRNAGFAGAAQLGLLLNAFGVGTAGFLWSRSVARPIEAEVPLVQLVIRWLLWVVIFQMLLGVQLVPSALLASLFAGMADAEIYVRASLQVFQMLIGCLFLVLPHLALGRWKELPGIRLQELVIAGGIAVGLGFVITNLPFLALSEVTRAGFQDFAPEAAFAAATTDQIIHLLFVIVAAGYFALVWDDLKDTAASRLPAEPVPSAPRERRTTRITRLTKAKR
jgi:hypothetical protein